MSNTTINATLYGTGTGTPSIGSGNIISTPSVYQVASGAHTHTINQVFNQQMHPYTIISMDYTQNFYFQKDGNEVLKIKDNQIKLNETDKLEVTELVSVFKYIKEDYPNLYADLILKGIIK